MCLHIRGTSQWNDAPKARSAADGKKTPAEEGASNENKEDNLSKHSASNNMGKKREKPTAQLVITETQHTSPSNRHDDREPKSRNMDVNGKKNPKQKELNEKKQQLTSSFIAEFTQQSTSKSGSTTCKKKKSVIHDNTLEEIPRDMPRYDSLQ
ncbi:unnamed protein product [Litomosoides sigmodontis]|uniref:Uncharacterized protein n=1 Tax=Litomosoides sigmodontis TaxID=42156 RepID=A0A3P6U889_LITSI|nr:unnamed protein product [Litomosoides sigmodontis]